MQQHLGDFPRSSRPYQKWLLLFNCQAQGLSNCLQLLTDRVMVECYDPSGITAHWEAIHERIGIYDRILIAPWVELSLKIDLGDDPRVWRVPTFLFPGYHPDLCHIAADGNLLGGPMSGNFSAISFAAFGLGLSEKNTLDLFCDELYQRLGYYQHWNVARDNFLNQFRAAGFDMSQDFVRWTRHGPFAYIPSHPKIHCLRDLAKNILTKAGVDVFDTDLLPSEQLAAGNVFPVYPEIASRLGVRGDYYFKPAGSSYRIKPLDEFVGESFQFFKASKQIAATAPFEQMVANTSAVIESVL